MNPIIVPGLKMVEVMNSWSKGQPVEYIQITVTRAGRKWATYKNSYGHEDRFDLNTLQIDGKGYSSPGRVYFSEDEHKVETRRQELWSKVQRIISSDYHNLSTIEEIKQAATILGIKLE